MDSTSCEYSLAQCQRALPLLSSSSMRPGISLCYGLYSLAIQPYLWLVDIYRHSQHSTDSHTSAYLRKAMHMRVVKLYWVAFEIIP